jgi:hypothetical protein
VLGHQQIGPRRDSTPLELGVGIGLCAVPSAFAVIAWWFGWRAGVAVALAVGLEIALACLVLSHGPRDRDGGS